MAEDSSSKDRLDQIAERLDYLEYALREQIARLYAIEQHLGLAQQATKPRQPQPTVKAPVEAEPPKSAPLLSSSPEIPPPSKGAKPAPSAVRPSFSSSPTAGASEHRERTSRVRPDLEARIVGNWFNRIAIFAIIFGVGFFLKYAFENQWIGPVGRVMIGIAAGLGFLIAGERVRARGYRQYAQGLSGGGIAILYLSIFAAFAFYQLIPQLPAFVFMMLVTTTAVLLAARYDALPIAVLGLIGGFLTPVLLSTGVDNEVGLFSYIALLDVGVLALAFFKQWRSLNYLSFFATALMVAVWMGEWYAKEKLWTTIFFLTLFFVIFALLAVFHNVINRRPTRWEDLGLILANAALYFSTSYELLEAEYHPYLGLFAVLMSAFYLGLGYFTYSRDREDRSLVLTFTGIAAIFLTLAVPIQLDQHWVTMGWALEGVVLAWTGLQTRSQATRYAALVVFLIAGLHWLGVDVSVFAYRADQTFVPLFNRRAASCLVLIGALAVAAWLYQKLGEQVAAEEREMLGGVYALGANALTVALLSLDANDYFEQAKMLARGQAGSVDFAGAREIERLENTRQLTLTALWSLYGAAALVIGILRRLKLLRLAALMLLGLAVLKVIMADAGYYAAVWHTPIFNQTFASFALLIAALSAGAWFYARAEGVDESERAIALPVITVAANLLAIIALSLEARGYFEAGIRERGEAFGELRNLQLGARLSLSVIWALYGGAMLMAGIWRRSPVLRVMALVLLGLTIFKVFLIDLSSLERIYRIISFIVLGAILLTVSFLYQQSQRHAAEREE
jgi:uncharacterized membrane protein